MNSPYQILDSSEIISPGLVVFRDIVEKNLDRMLEIAGGPARLRPHCKTHKMVEVAKMQLDRGIDKHKAATFSEAEMLVSAGVRDVFLAYSMVGPNIGRAVRFVAEYPKVVFSVTADDAESIQRLGQAMSAAGHSIQVLLDIDTGQHRTGVEVGSLAERLYRQIMETDGLIPGGLHVYDGQNHQSDLAERRTAVLRGWSRVAEFRDTLVARGCSVPRIVSGGTGSFPVYASLDDPTIELSPGTCIFFDAGYGGIFPDLKFTPAALLLTRVISRPTSDRVTLDLGYKAVASDQPAERRVVFPEIPDAKTVLQNEEHLVIETSRAEQYRPGDELLAIPRHICPTSALHKQVFVVSQGALQGRWNVAARDRWLNI